VGITGWMILSRPGKKEPVARQQAMAVSKNSEALNTDIAGLLTVYNKLSESFVNWDSTKTKTLADSLNRQLTTLSFDSLQRDTSGIFETAQAFIENAKGDAQTIAAEPGIRQQREAFNSLSDRMSYGLRRYKICSLAKRKTGNKKSISRVASSHLRERDAFLRRNKNKTE
jgi:hypothetical protein